MNALAKNVVPDVTPFFFEQLDVEFQSEHGVLWHFLAPKPRPVFTIKLLAELRTLHAALHQSGGIYFDGFRNNRVNYLVLASKNPQIFSLGGDLSLFRDAIVRGDREQLLEYGKKCVDNLYPWSRNLESPLTTIALVQGEALGGGFECVLAASVVVAEETARMGFPEILFNLFPGMGAYSFLIRKVGRRVADELVTSGTIYGARQLYEMGVIDVLAPEGEGQVALEGYIRKHARAGNGRRAMELVRNEILPVTRQELLRIVEIWAEAALRLADRDLRMMERLVRAQSRNDKVLSLPATVTPLPRK